MEKLKNIYLPGSDKQFAHFIAQIDLLNKNILIMGSGTGEIAKALAGEGNNVMIIVNDQNSLLQLRYFLSGAKDISVRMMDFANTDFPHSQFDIVYAQASVSTFNRSKIVKEVKRILKEDGIFCVGEIVNLTNNPPQFVKDIWETSELSPLSINELNNFYLSRNFEIISEEDLSGTLKDFYSLSSSKLKEVSGTLSEDERVYNKKLLKKISHESNVYLKLGGQNHMGFKMLILKKAGN